MRAHYKTKQNKQTPAPKETRNIKGPLRNSLRKEPECSQLEQSDHNLENLLPALVFAAARSCLQVECLLPFPLSYLLACFPRPIFKNTSSLMKLR